MSDTEELRNSIEAQIATFPRCFGMLLIFFWLVLSLSKRRRSEWFRKKSFPSLCYICQLATTQDRSP